MRHLLSVAGDEFVTRGFAEASVSRIARDAGVSKKTIYARFPTKDALLFAVLEDFISGARDAVLDGMPTMAGEPAQVLTRFGMRLARDWTTPRVVAMYRLIINEVVRFPQLAEIFTSTVELIRSTLTDYLREQATAGTLAITDPEAACRQFGMLAYGELRERTMLGEAITEERLTATVQRAVQLFLHGYAVGAPRQPSPVPGRA
jgi:AcrR family transcriptional regulator